MGRMLFDFLLLIHALGSENVNLEATVKMGLNYLAQLALLVIKSVSTQVSVVALAHLASSVPRAQQIGSHISAAALMYTVLWGALCPLKRHLDIIRSIIRARKT